MARAYLIAVEDLSDYAIRTAAKEFLQGTIAGQDKRFAPPAPAFAERARLHETNAANSIRFLALHPDKLENPELPDEYRAEMRRRIAALPGPRRVSFKAGDPDGHSDAA